MFGTTYLINVLSFFQCVCRWLNESLWYALQLYKLTNVDKGNTAGLYYKPNCMSMWVRSVSNSTTGAEILKSLNDYISGKFDPFVLEYAE